MENAVAVHVLDGLEQLVDVELDTALRQVVGAALDCLVEVHLHDFEYEREAARRLVVEHLDQLDDVAVGREALERLDLTQVLDL